MTHSTTLSRLDQLRDAGLLSADVLPELNAVAAQYAVGVTEHLAARIKNADDPIARMFLPSTAELRTTPEERVDPIGDEAHTPLKGIVHRYPGRLLLKPVGVCPVYCRFCFRREMVGPGLGETLTRAELDAALHYVRDNPAVKEVILTGGDPFMLSPKRAREITEALGAMAHVKIIRWHTRMPVADPARITPDFIEALKAKGRAVYVSVHINHLAELSEETEDALCGLADAGFPLLAQTVLLKGVNASAAALAELFEALIALRVRPYYLHHPDLAKGTSHFRLSIEEGQAIYSDLRDRISGIAIPQYILDIPGGVSKANIAPSDVNDGASGTELRGRDGRQHAYRDEFRGR